MSSPEDRITAVSLIRAIALGGLVAGSLDVLVAALINHARVGVILQAIASGVLGRASFHGGVKTMVLGLVLQWAMSLVIAAIYIVAGARWRRLLRQPARFGALYGVGVFVVMNFVVVPLSVAWPKGHHSLADSALNLAAMVIFGLIVAFTPYLMRVGRR